MNKKISVVVLNYMNYKDTIECVNSIIKMKYDISGIVIVENGSINESFDVLSKYYRDNKTVYIKKNKHNLGFAKGNNIGIDVARDIYKTDFVFVVNNDTLFEDVNFFDILLKNYKKGVGVIGPRILLNNREPQIKVYYDFNRRNVLYEQLRQLLVYKNKREWSVMIPLNEKPNFKFVLSGCALLFTPDFFRYYKGFCDKTFLYYEEPILKAMCDKYNLKQVYEDSTYIYHKEDQSSNMSFREEKNDIISKYTYDSKWEFYLYLLKNKMR